MTKRSYPSHGRFPHAWRVGELVFTSGQVALDEQGLVIGPGDIEAQTRAAFENLRRALRTAGCDTCDLIKLNTYLVFNGDEHDFSRYWARMHAARSSFISEDSPAATAVRVTGFSVDGLLIEVDGIAAVPNDERRRQP